MSIGLERFFQDVQRMSDRRVIFLSLEEDNIDDLEPITMASGMFLNIAGMCGCVPIFFYSQRFWEKNGIFASVHRILG